MNHPNSTRSCVSISAIVGVFVAAMVGAMTTAVPAYAELDGATAKKLREVMASEHRSDKARARDAFRRPFETLEFLGLSSHMTVVEMWPGGGWYSDILAPVLDENGTFYAAHYSPNAPNAFQRSALGSFLTKLGTNPDLFGNVVVTQFDLPYSLRIAPAASADMVLTFRNVHNLVMEYSGGGAYAGIAMQAAFDALKPGGVFGVVDHEWDDPTNEDAFASNGYISRQRTIELAETAGFEFVAASDVLNNDKDTKDHPRGVWTLPPSFALGETDKDKYEAIGESDRFLLKFVKPVTPAD